jgi:hypothetical protein
MPNDTKAPVTTAREAIAKFGSADSTNWRVMALFAVPAFSSTLFFEMARLGGSPFVWFWLTTGAYLVTVTAVWLLSEAANQRSWTSSKPLTVLVILLAAGVARGTFMYFVGMQVGVVPADDAWYRLISAPMFVTFSFFFFSIPVTAHLEHRRMLAQLTKERSQLDRLQTNLAVEVKSHRTELTSQARRLLEPAIWELRKHLADAVTRGSVQQAVSEISRITDSMVRPISHRFAKEEQYGLQPSAEPAPIKAETDVWPRRVNLGTMLPVFFIFAAGLISGGPAVVLVEGAAEGLLSALVMAITYTSLAWLVGRLLRNVEMATLPGLVLIMLLLAGVGASFYPLNLLLQINQNFGIQSIAFVSQMGVLIFIFQLVQLRRKLLLERLAAINENIEALNQRLRQELWLTQRDISLLLHGPVQGAFYAAAMKLSNTPKLDEALIEEIRADIGAALLKLNSNSIGQSTALKQQVESIADAWGDSLEINFAADRALLDELANDAVATRVVVEVIREAITNAVKHGAATKISISLVRNLVGVRVTVENDGLPPQPQAAGLGTEMFDEVSSGWSLAQTAEGTRLELEIALANQRPDAMATAISSAVGGSQPMRSQTSAAATAATSAAD